MFLNEKGMTLIELTIVLIILVPIILVLLSITTNSLDMLFLSAKEGNVVINARLALLDISKTLRGIDNLNIIIDENRIEFEKKGTQQAYTYDVLTKKIYKETYDHLHSVWTKTSIVASKIEDFSIIDTSEDISNPNQLIEVIISVYNPKREENFVLTSKITPLNI